MKLSTLALVDPTSSVGMLVRVRPYYLVPVDPNRPDGSQNSARWAFTIPGTVVEARDDMVVVEHRESGAWGERAIYFMRELHNADICECDACRTDGPGIAELRGA